MAIGTIANAASDVEQHEHATVNASANYVIDIAVAVSKLIPKLGYGEDISIINRGALGFIIQSPRGSTIVKP